MKDTRAIFSHPTLPEGRTYNNSAFPLLVTPPPSHADLSSNTEAAHEYLRSHREHIFSLLHEHSVLIFRNFGQKRAEDFGRFMEDCLGLVNFPYVGGNAVRTAVVGDRVFTANESPPDKAIPFHHELAQTPNYPRYIAFFCEREAEWGGETPVVYSPKVYEELQKRAPEFLEEVEKNGVRYMRVMTREDRPHSAIGRGWMSTFGAKNRKEVENVLRERGYDWEWIGEGENAKLKEISPVLKAVVDPGGGGRKSFFNQLVAVAGGWTDEFNQPGECLRAGDGRKLDEEGLQIARMVMEEEKVAVPWRRGDVMLVDNLMAMHARATFGGRRRVLASLAKERQHQVL